MKKDNLIFLRPFNIKDPTLEEQNEFMMQEVLSIVELSPLGHVYNNDMLYEKDLRVFIPEEIKRHHPQWVVAENECATIALSMKMQKKILLNPKVVYNDLNYVSEYARQNTYGFFDAKHEHDYELFNSVYPNVAYYPQTDDLLLVNLKEIIQSIIETE